MSDVRRLEKAGYRGVLLCQHLHHFLPEYRLPSPQERLLRLSRGRSQGTRRLLGFIAVQVGRSAPVVAAVGGHSLLAGEETSDCSVEYEGYSCSEIVLLV